MRSITQAPTIAATNAAAATPREGAESGAKQVRGECKGSAGEYKTRAAREQSVRGTRGFAIERIASRRGTGDARCVCYLGTVDSAHPSLTLKGEFEMDGKPGYAKCSNKLVSAMREIVRLALVDKFPNPRMESDEAEHLLDALHVLRPGRPELILYDGFVHIVHRNWIDAIGVFEGLAAKGECMPGSKAMLVYCLSASGNPDWRIVAGQLHEDESGLTEDARVLLDSVELRADLEQAHRDAQLSGSFQMPESMARLQARLGIKLPEAEVAEGAA